MYETMRITPSKYLHLPYDIVVNILSRVGVKTLLRLRCVCKSWNSIITNPTFITMHLNHASSCKNNNGFLQYFNLGSNSRRLVWYLLCEKTYVHHLELKAPIFNFPLLVGSVNGLVCLSTDCHKFGENICLWNPSIRKSKTVSLSSPFFPFPQHSEYQNYFALGFGFHSQTNDFKIVRTLYCRDVDCKYIANSSHPVEVYSLNMDSWRQIEASVPCYGSQQRSHAFFNESIHWVAYRSVAHPNHRDMIMSFDIGGEIFGEMMLPDYDIDDPRGRAVDLRLAVIKELLSLCVFFELSGHCDIWVMSEYGVVESWTKHFTIGMQERIERTFDDIDNDVVLLLTRSNMLFSYDLESLQLKNLGIQVACYTSNAFPFMETLVLLGDI